MCYLRFKSCVALPWRGCTWDRIPASPPHFHTWGPDAGTRTLENNNSLLIRSCYDQCCGSELVSTRSGSSIFGQWGSGSRVLITKNCKKFTAKKSFFFIKNCNLLILRPNKERRSYRRRILHPSKENTRHFITWNFFTLIFALLDPDQHSQCVSGSTSRRPKWMRIRQLAMTSVFTVPYLSSQG